eukprot:scaffold1883_cov261-Pinguiococcus_pyrenoidosus.AAC.33
MLGNTNVHARDALHTAADARKEGSAVRPMSDYVRDAAVAEDGPEASGARSTPRSSSRSWRLSRKQRGGRRRRSPAPRLAPRWRFLLTPTTRTPWSLQGPRRWNLDCHARRSQPRRPPPQSLLKVTDPLPVPHRNEKCHPRRRIRCPLAQPWDFPRSLHSSKHCETCTRWRHHPVGLRTQRHLAGHPTRPVCHDLRLPPPLGQPLYALRRHSLRIACMTRMPLRHPTLPPLPRPPYPRPGLSSDPLQRRRAPAASQRRSRHRRENRPSFRCFPQRAAPFARHPAPLRCLHLLQGGWTLPVAALPRLRLGLRFRLPRWLLGRAFATQGRRDFVLVPRRPGGVRPAALEAGGRVRSAQAPSTLGQRSPASVSLAADPRLP